MNDMPTLNRANWLWRENGVEVGLCTDQGDVIRIFVPLRHVSFIFSEELDTVGCRVPSSVSGPRTVGGFFSGLKKAYLGATRSVKRALPKVARQAIHRVERTAEQAAKLHYQLARSQLNLARSAVRNPYFRTALTAAAVAVPALAPAAAAVHLANRIDMAVRAGKAAAYAFKQGSRSPDVLRRITAGAIAKQGLVGMVSKAQQGNQAAMQVIGAFQRMH